MIKRSVSPIGDVLKTVFSRLEKEKNVSKEAVDELWKSTAGENAFKHSRPSSLRKKILYVSVDSSAWMQQLSLEKRKILKGLKRELGKDRISDIHLKVGEF